ncbi:ABC transporter substrate-binding protein [bacterium]|nr:ABC transporter substrate-binding protein [bacterium]
MLHKKYWFGLGLLIMLLACGVLKNRDQGPKYGGTIRWVLLVTPSAFSPFSNMLWDYAAVQLIFEGLVRYSDQDFRIEPALATSWQTSLDGLTWTFQLRQGVRFHDGTPFNAEAVKFHFERIVTDNHAYAPPEFGRADRDDWSQITIRQIETPSEYEIIFKLEKPFTFVLDMLSSDSASIMSPASVIKWGDQVKYHPSGTGPFKLVEYVPERFCLLEANLDYHAGRPYVDTVEFYKRSDIHSRYGLELLSGALDGALYLSPVEAALKRDSRIMIQTGTGYNLNYFVLNPSRPPLDNTLVRQALRYAFDQEALCQRLSRNTNDPIATILPSPFLPGHLQPRNHYPYDPQKARQLLTQAGFRSDVNVTYMDTASLLISATFNHVYYLGKFLEKAGVTLDIDSGVDSKTYWQRIESNDFNIYFTQNFSSSGNALLFLKSLIDLKITPSGTSSFVNNKEIEQRILEQLYNPHSDPAAVDRAVAEIVDLIEAGAYFIPYDNVGNRAVYSTRLKGFKLHPLMARYNFARVWKEE